MKKKTAPKKTTVKKTVKRTIPKSSPRSSSNQTFVFRRIIIVSACLVLAVIIGVLPYRSQVSQAVAGAQIVNGLYNQTSIQIPTVLDAKSYNIYYRQTGQQSFTNAVRNIPANVHIYTISYLKKNTPYQYRISAVKNGKEYYFSPIQTLT